jgi:acetylglutamate kinase
LNSEVGKLNRQVTSLKTLSLLINNNFRPVSTDLIKSNLEMIQSNLPPNYKPLISPILNSNNLKVMDKEINRVARLIAKDINGDTLHFLQNISKY